MQLNGKATIQIRIGLDFLDRRSYRMTILVQIPIFYEMANLNFVEKEGEIEAKGRSPRKKLILAPVLVSSRNRDLVSST